jgi:hypothetical protein
MPVGEHVIVYVIEGDDAFILRVVHGRRDLETLFGHSPSLPVTDDFLRWKASTIHI